MVSIFVVLMIIVFNSQLPWVKRSIDLVYHLFGVL
jgi:hypothetical protein